MRYESEFKKALDLGKATEHAVLLCPKLWQYWITPLTDIANGAAPRMFGPRGYLANAFIVTPDFEADRPGEHYGLEIKGKDHPDKTDCTDALEHGFSQRLIHDYLEWQHQTDKRVILLVDEASTGEIIAASLSRLMGAGYLF